MDRSLVVVLKSVLNIGGLSGAVVFAPVCDRLGHIGFFLLGTAFFLEGVLRRYRKTS